MLQFLSSFSSSFLLALLIWPFLALFITIPIFILQYRRYNRLVFSRCISTYFFILSCLALISFTLYPMPDNSAVFCAEYHLVPQLNPLQFISDIQSEGLRAILQVVMNILFFVPFGFFARRLLHFTVTWTLISGLLISLFIETAQLTGAFGLYPCSYRLFDVDDLIFNTLGVAMGYGVGRLLPQRIYNRAKRGEYTKKAGLVRYTVRYLIDLFVVGCLYIFIVIALYLMLGNEVAVQAQTAVYAASIVLIFGVLPFVQNGWSIGGYFTRMKHDDRERVPLRRILFYGLRTLYIGALLMAPAPWPFLLIVVLLVCWFWKKKLVYQFI